MVPQPQKEDVIWSSVAVRVGVNILTHPIEYAKVLIQVGHEPIPPYPTKTLFGKPALALPNVFQYVHHIRQVDGIWGCYRGLGARLVANVISGVTYQKVTENIHFEGEDKIPQNEDELTDEEKRQIFARSMLRDLAGRMTAIIVSQPFNVIAIRTMCQFVGGETKYTGLVASFREVYQENGIGGFFSGLVPRMIGEALTLIIASSLTFVINTYLIEERELKQYTTTSMAFIASAITYPFTVVSNCMAVTDSGLSAGQPPNMPLYLSWRDCWRHLSYNNQLKRGSSMLWRYYTGPQVVLNGRVLMLTPTEYKSA